MRLTGRAVSPWPQHVRRGSHTTVSIQHTGGHALSSLRAKAIQPFRWAVCSYITPPAFALQLYDRNRATDQHPRSARSPWTDNDSVGQRASRLPTSGAPTSAPTTRGSSRNGDQETGDGAIASVSSREALAPAAVDDVWTGGLGCRRFWALLPAYDDALAGSGDCLRAACTTPQSNSSVFSRTSLVSAFTPALEAVTYSPVKARPTTYCANGVIPTSKD